MAQKCGFFSRSRVDCGFLCETKDRATSLSMNVCAKTATQGIAVYSSLPQKVALFLSNTGIVFPLINPYTLSRDLLAPIFCLDGLDGTRITNTTQKIRTFDGR